MARGTVAEELAALRATVEAKMKSDDERDKRAQEQRDAMSRDIAAIRSDANTIDNRVKNIEKNLDTINPVIDRVTGWQNKAIGGMVVLGMLGTAVTLFWDAFKAKIVAIFSGG